MSTALAAIEAMKATASASQTTQTCGRSDWLQRLRQPALEPERREQRGELDHHHRQREAPDQVGAVEPPRDEQERDAREQPQHEAGDVGPPALGERVDVRGVGHRVSIIDQCAAPQLAPVPISIRQRHASVTAGAAAVAMTRSITGSPPRRRLRAVRRPVRRGPGAACGHGRAPPRRARAPSAPSRA